MIELEDGVIDAMLRHAAEDYPREACGLVLRHPDGGQAYAACRNQAEGDDQFRIHPEDFAAAEDLGELLAVFHSHPDSDARPTMADRVSAELHGLPWVIVSHPGGDVLTFQPSGFKAPLLGRPFFHGMLDCWSLCRDYYARERGLQFPDYPREDAWWERTATSMYTELYREAGFRRVEVADVAPGDMLVMRVGRTLTENHAGIYLGSDPFLRSEPEAPALGGQGPFMLHHLYGRSSERVVFGGNWAERTSYALRPEGA